MIAATGAAAISPAGTRQPGGETAGSLDLDQIQGNIIGFQKDFQSFLFLRFPDGRTETVREWLRGVADEVATGSEVLEFNRLFKKLKDRRHGREGTIKATWLNIAFTYKGLQELGANGLGGFPEEFRQGMRRRAEELGDVGESAPQHWVFPADGGAIHAVILLASDSQADLDAEAGHQIAALTAAGIQLLFKQDGADRQDQPGHEHFGFKDGVSQPGIRDDRVTPIHGKAGQARVSPGEFVLGYPREATAPAEGAYESPRRDAVEPLPEWTRNGSYLVFRRLRQDVRGFRDFVREQANDLGLSEDLLGAKLVGRYRSGAPLEALNTHVDGANRPGIPQAETDPGRCYPHLLSSEHINDFGYETYDPAGRLVPHGAHIRKVYPRDQAVPGQAEANARRILRRGIPFGRSYREDAPDHDPEGARPAFPHDRGLLFLCYQRSIEEQFEFLQRRWANNPAFPRRLQPDDPHPGHDPIIGQAHGPREFDIPGLPGGLIELLERWVVTTGGDYFFSPSIDALCLLADHPRKERHTMSSVESLAANGKKYRAAGSCTVLITVAAAELLKDTPGAEAYPNQRFEWRVVVAQKEGEETVWRSNDFTHLTVNTQRIATGSAQVSVRKLLQALVRALPGRTLEGILELITPEWLEANPDQAYRTFYLQVLVGDRYVKLPIDMGVSDGGRP